MGGISTGVGLISGINTGQLIDQLLAIEAHPKNLAQSRVLDLQQQQAAYLDLVGKLGSLKSASQNFRLNKIFQTTNASSTNGDVLSATSNPGAIPGSYTFVADRVATTQQLLSRAFTDRSSSSLGLTSVIVESDKARLDSDTSLSQLNGGNGVSRGKVVVTDGKGATTTIDLSKAATVDDVLDAFNTNTGVQVSASVKDGRFVIQDKSGGAGGVRVASAAGSTTAESLGIAKFNAPGSITGDVVYTIGDNTTLQSLNDGNGIRFNTAAGTSTPDFSVSLQDGSTYQVDIGDLFDSQSKKTAGQVNTVGELRARVKAQTDNKLDVQVRADGRGLKLVDTTTGSATFSATANVLSGSLADLGLTGAASGGAVTGNSVLADLNSVLGSTLNGGAGIADGTFNITAHDGSAFAFSVDSSGSVSDIIRQISTATGGKVSASLSDRGNSLVLTDNTSGVGPLTVGGAGAVALGVATDVSGTSSGTVNGTRVARQYITSSTLLSTLNGGAGVGTGTFQIVGANGNTASVTIGTTAKNIGDVIAQINGTTSHTGVQARIDDSGSGIVVEAAAGITSVQKISISDSSGTVAKSLNLAGTSTDLVANKVDGTFRRTITLDAADTLDGVVTKINGARSGISASVISDGNPVTPYRLKIGAVQSGRSGRQIVESTGSSDLNLSTIAAGEDARLFVGSEDPAKAILITRSSNSIDGVIDNVHIDLKGTLATPITLTVSRDDSSIQKAATDFVSAFNAVSSKINDLTSYDASTNKAGTLLGDSTAGSLQSSLLSSVTRQAPGLSGKYTFFAQVGITIGTGGQLTLDSTKLQAAINDDPQAVADLFAAQVQNTKPATVPIAGIAGATVVNTAPDTYSSLGLGEVIAQLADKYTDSTSGVLINRNKTLDDQIKFQNDRIADFDVRLASKRQVLENQFSQMEQALAQLQQQQSAIGNIGK